MTAPVEIRPTRRRAAVSAERLRTNLGVVVGQLNALHRYASHARYRLAGAEMPGLRLHLDGVVWTVRHATGTIAERPVAVDAGAAVTAVIREILAVVDTIGPIRAILAATDLSTAELLGAVADVLREQASTLQRDCVERHVPTAGVTAP